MSDKVIITANKPRRQSFGIGPEAINSVRAFRIDPETVRLQIRMEKHFITVALTPDETHELIAGLLDALPAEVN